MTILNAYSCMSYSNDLVLPLQLDTNTHFVIIEWNIFISNFIYIIKLTITDNYHTLTHISYSLSDGNPHVAI